MAHSMSCGAPKRRWTPSPSAVSSWSWGPLRLGPRPGSVPPGVLRDPEADAVSSTNWSGLTAPETTAWPEPGLALITVSVRVPVTGFAVNRTPAVAASTMTWTTTASPTSRLLIPLAERYATARSLQSDAQQRRTASTTASAPVTSR